MANYQTIINRINEEITTNGQMRITGAVLNGVLTAMVASLGTGCRFGGIVTPNGTVTEPDGNVFYFATQGGTYAACGGVVIQDGVSVIKYDGGTWGAMQLLLYDTEPRQGSTRLVLSGGIYDSMQAQEERFRGVEQDMADLIAKIFDDEEVYQVTKVYSASVTDTNSRQTARKNRTYLNEISTKDGAVITSLKVEMGGADITKDVYTGPHSAEIIGHASGNEASDLQNGDSWASGEITPDAGWGIKSVRVQMGDDDITSEALSGHEVSVDDVKGDIAVEVETACDVVDEPFLSRITANGLTLANNRALLKGINGNTIVWNQMVSNGQGTSGVGGWSGRNTGNLSFASDGSIEVNAKVNNSTNGIFTAVNFTKDHKYYINIPCKSYTKKVNIAVTQVGGWGGAFYPATNHDGSYKGIVNAAVAGDKIVIYLLNVTSSDIDTAKNVYQPIQIFDLTQMFGAGNEPTLAEFESLYPLGYYTTAAGRLLDFKGETLRSVGFNLWDEENESGLYNSNGNKVDNSSYKRSVNAIRVSPNTSYFAYNDTNNNTNVSCYDGNGTFIERKVANGVFTTPSNCLYIRLHYYITNNNPTKHCINLSNTSLNGTYKPYSAQDITIDPTAMYGYLNGEGNAVRPFENGMRSAGSVFDEVYKEDGKWYAKTNVGSVDLGSLTWAKKSGDSGYDSFFFYAQRIGPKGYGQGTISNNYVINTTMGGTAYNPYLMPDKNVKFNSYVAVNCINIKDTSYTDAATFKSAMDGVMLNYQLATPRTYLLTDGWQQILNSVYQVETGGMEIILPENGSEPTTSPAKMEIQYGTDGIENN